MNRARAVRAGAILLASFLFAVSLVGAYVALQAGETADLVSAVLTLLLTGLLLVGVARELTGSRRWRIAFFAGVAVWGGYEYATVGDVFSLVLAVLGAVMVAAAVLEVG